MDCGIRQCNKVLMAISHHQTADLSRKSEKFSWSDLPIDPKWKTLFLHFTNFPSSRVWVSKARAKRRSVNTGRALALSHESALIMVWRLRPTCDGEQRNIRKTISVIKKSCKRRKNSMIKINLGWSATFHEGIRWHRCVRAQSGPASRPKEPEQPTTPESRREEKKVLRKKKTSHRRQEKNCAKVHSPPMQLSKKTPRTHTHVSEWETKHRPERCKKSSPTTMENPIWWKNYKFSVPLYIFVSFAERGLENSKSSLAGELRWSCTHFFPCGRRLLVDRSAFGAKKKKEKQILMNGVRADTLM